MEFLVNYNDRIIFTSDGKQEVLIKEDGDLVYYTDKETENKFKRNLQYLKEVDNLENIKIVIEDDLKEAEKLVKKLFKDKEDKAGKPYINHLLFVCENVETIQEKIVALLHDTLEDIDDIDYKDLVFNFGANVAQAVDTLTKQKDVEYEDYIDSIKGNYIATNVKLADLKNNSDLTRLDKIDNKDLKRTKKYKKAYKYLKEGIK